MRVIAKVQCQKCRDYFCFPFANRRRTSSWSDISFSSPLWWLALFFLLFLCFLEVVTGSSGWGSFSLFFLFLVEVVTTVSGSGDGDRVRFFLCFFLGGVAYVMNSSASSFFVLVDVDDMSPVLGNGRSVEWPFVLLCSAVSQFIVLGQVVFFVQRAGLISGFLSWPRQQLVLFVVALG